MTTADLAARVEVCGTCCFRSTNPYVTPDRGTAEFHDIMFACKRRAPVATGGLHCPTMTIWPMVARNDWCGEYRALSQEKNA